VKLQLREVGKENLREVLRLKVSPEQEKFVASNAVSIAQAYFDRETAWFRAIYDGGTPVGFVMLDDQPAKPAYTLWRFMIDARYQRRGYGRAALELVFAHVKGRPGATELLTSCVDAPGGPGPFYEGLGFAYTGELDEDESVMRRPL
jgi:diamine N-acetyltransferase